MKPDRYLLSMLLALTTSLSGQSAPARANTDIAISPPYLEFAVGQQSRTQSFTLINFADRPVKVKTSVHNWTLDENNQVKLIPAEEQSLDGWLIINPLEFTIPAKGQQTVRLGARPRIQPTAGEHRAMIYFDVAPLTTPAGSIAVQGRLGAAVYGYVGDLRREGTLHGVAIETQKNSTQAIFDISSSGQNNVRMSGQYAIWPADRFPGADKTTAIVNLNDKTKTANATAVMPAGVVSAGFLPSLPILPASRRRIPLLLPKTLPPGRYVLDINGRLGDRVLDRGWPFVVAP